MDDMHCPNCGFIYERSVPCRECGGTGDAFDRQRDDWAKPRRDCETCDGSGECH